MVDYGSGANTNPEMIREKLKQDFNDTSSKLNSASIDLAEVEKRLTPIGFLDGILNPNHFGIQYSSFGELEDMQKRFKTDVENLSKDKENKKKYMDDFEQVILGNKKYSELFPDITYGTEYVIMWPDGENRGYGDETPGDLYLGKIDNGKVYITSPSGKYREYNFSEGGNGRGGKYDKIKYNDDIFRRLVLDTADKYYDAQAKLNKGNNPKGVVQQLSKKWNLTRGRKELSKPIQGETPYTTSGYNSYVQDLIDENKRRL